MLEEVKKGLLRPKRGTNVLPEDALTSAHLSSKPYGHTGLPEGGDCLAYDPLQRLLAVGTRDGQTKLVGQAGVEALFISRHSAPTLLLLIISQKGVLLRYEDGGKLQLWSLVEGVLLDEVSCPQKVCTAVWLQDTPYICLGCENGLLLTMQLLTAAGEPAEGICQAIDLEILIYELHASDLNETGQLVHLSCVVVSGLQRLLVVHSSGATVWDVRHQASLAKTSAGVVAEEAHGITDDCQTILAQIGPFRSGCWLGEDGLMFATGHEMGHLLVWLVPEDASDMGHQAGTELLMRVAISPNEDIAMPVRDIKFVEGSKGAFDRSVICLGGQSLDMPDSLSLVSLSSAHNDDPLDIQSVPWYGNIKGFEVIPEDGSLGSRCPAAAIAVLIESGQLFLFDSHLSPNPLSLQLQELPQLTISRLESPVSQSCGPHGVNTEGLQHAKELREADHPEASGSRWRWVLEAGKPAEPHQTRPNSGTILYTGHSDGRVRVWNAETAVPMLQATVPFDSGGAGAKLKPVSAIQVCHSTGVLIVGHSSGEIRVYQFSLSSNQIDILVVQGTQSAVSEGFNRSQPPGFQLLCRMMVSEAEITSLSLDPPTQVLAAGDLHGMVFVLDLAKPQMLSRAKAFTKPVLEVLLSRAPCEPEVDHKSASDKLAVYATSVQGELVCIDAASGDHIGSKIVPKSLSQALMLVLLDESGQFIAGNDSAIKFDWAQNDSEKVASPDHATAPEAFSPRSRKLGRRLQPLKDPFLAAENGSSEDLRERYSNQSGLASPKSQIASPLSQSDVDEDSFLAAAAEAASPTKRLPSKKSNSQKRLQAERNIKHAKEAMQRLWSKKEAMDAKKEATDMSTGMKTGTGSLPGSRSSSRGHLKASTPAPAFILVATETAIRLYPAECFLESNRTTLAKTSLEKPICVAQTFTARGAPALACLSATGHLQVFSVPGLQLVAAQGLSSVLGYDWSWGNAQSPEKLQKMCSIAEGGQAFLPKANGEAVRLAMCHTAPSPATHACLIDQDLNKAAQAARQRKAPKILPRVRPMPAASSDDSSDEMSGTPTSTDTPSSRQSDGLRTATSDQKKGFGGLLHSVRDGVANVGTLVEGTGKGLGKELGNVISSRVRKPRKKEPPPLNRVFNSRKELQVTQPSPQYPGLHYSKSRQNESQPLRKSFSSREPAVSHGGEVRSEDEKRRELLGERIRQTRSARPGPRTADEIKRAYGRPTRPRADSAAAIANENRTLLAERGERLNQLGSKAETMANDASNFASLAQQLKQKEAKKKWWQF